MNTQILVPACGSVNPVVLPPIEPACCWRRICQVEPALRQVESYVAGLPDDARTWPAWSTIKRALSRLVGWNAKRRELRTCEAYDAAYSRLLDLFEVEGSR